MVAVVAIQAAVAAVATGIRDVDGQRSDRVEVHNPGSTASSEAPTEREAVAFTITLTFTPTFNDCSCARGANTAEPRRIGAAPRAFVRSDRSLVMWMKVFMAVIAWESVALRK